VEPRMRMHNTSKKRKAPADVGGGRRSFLVRIKSGRKRELGKVRFLIRSLSLAIHRPCAQTRFFVRDDKLRILFENHVLLLLADRANGEQSAAKILFKRSKRLGSHFADTLHD